MRVTVGVSVAEVGLLPRFGIAYRLHDGTSLRFGYRVSIQPSVDIEGGINLNAWFPIRLSQDSFPLPSLQGVPQGALSDPSRKHDPWCRRRERVRRYSELGSTAASIVQKQNLSNAYTTGSTSVSSDRSSARIVVDSPTSELMGSISATSSSLTTSTPGSHTNTRIW